MTRSPLSLLCLMLLTALPAAPALSQEDETLAALDLADSAEFSPDAYQALNMMFEAASSINQQQEKEQRLSLDMRLDAPLGEKWRLVLSNRWIAGLPTGSAKPAIPIPCAKRGSATT